LGIMGAPMAGHLQKGGHALCLFDLMPELPGDLLTGGAMARDSGRAVAEASDIVILMVPDTPDVAAALFADNCDRYEFHIPHRHDGFCQPDQ